VINKLFKNHILFFSPQCRVLMSCCQTSQHYCGNVIVCFLFYQKCVLHEHQRSSRRNANLCSPVPVIWHHLATGGEKFCHSQQFPTLSLWHWYR